MDVLKRILKQADQAIVAALKWICVAIFVVIALILTMNIVVRFVPIFSLHWLDEIIELCFAALAFYGAAAVWISRAHFSAGDWIGKRLPSPRAKAAYRFCVELLSLAFIALFFRYSLNLTLRAGEATAVFQIPKFWLYVCMPVSAAIMGVYSIAYAFLAFVGILKPEPAVPGEAASG